jgi:hypothetical protein
MGLGSGKNLFRIPDPKVKKDPQHCLQDDGHVELLDDEVHHLTRRRRRRHLDAHARPVRKASLVCRVHLGKRKKIIQKGFFFQCGGSASTRIRIYFGQLDPDTDLHWEYGSGSRRAKITHKSYENSSFDVHF